MTAPRNWLPIQPGRAGSWPKPHWLVVLRLEPRSAERALETTYRVGRVRLRATPKGPELSWVDGSIPSATDYERERHPGENLRKTLLTHNVSYRRLPDYDGG